MLPSAYEACLCHELHLRHVTFERKHPLALSYKGAPLGEEEEVELLVGGRIVVSPCALTEVQPVHEARLRANFDWEGGNWDCSLTSTRLLSGRVFGGS